MAESSESERAMSFTAVAARVEPAGRLLGIRTLAGGLSAEMTVLEVVAPGGVHRPLVVRQVRDPDRARRNLSLADEFGLLVALRARGLPTPTPRLFDDSGTVLDHPYAVFDYVDGSPRVHTTDPAGTGRCFASALAAVHEIDGSSDICAGLPRRAETVGRLLAETPGKLDESLREGFLRELLAAHWPPPEPDRLVLLHGDFWVGNLLWKDDEIVAAIDWEEASVGDPLADVATTRLDLLWAFGRDAMSAFTDHYLFLTSTTGAPPIAASGPVLPGRTPRPAGLALWDLVAALRPAGAFSAWVADWPAFGRPDMTAATMRERHRFFLNQALSAFRPSG
jgi:aminoglycoside phosphotransferase (APT) family kinase protein